MTAFLPIDLKTKSHSFTNHVDFHSSVRRNRTRSTYRRHFMPKTNSSNHFRCHPFSIQGIYITSVHVLMFTRINCELDWIVGGNFSTLNTNWFSRLSLNWFSGFMDKIKPIFYSKIRSKKRSTQHLHLFYLILFCWSWKLKKKKQEKTETNKRNMKTVYKM